MLTEKDYCGQNIENLLAEVGFPIRDYQYCLQGQGQGVFIRERVSLYEAQKWLREEKNIIVEVFVDDDSNTPITYNIYKDGECVCHHHGKYWSVKEWSEALSEGVKCAVKILKEK